MNPMTNVKNINKLNDREIQLGIKASCSWHKIYQKSPWLFIGGLDYELTEGDIICVFSQYGEVEDINLIRDKKTGKSKGFCFLCYQSNKSTILAVDNFNGIKICGRTIRVDHVANYRPPKEESESSHSEGEEDTLDIIDPKGKKERRRRRKEQEEERAEGRSQSRDPRRNWGRQEDEGAERKSRRGSGRGYPMYRGEEREWRPSSGYRGEEGGRRERTKRPFQMDFDFDNRMEKHRRWKGGRDGD